MTNIRKITVTNSIPKNVYFLPFRNSSNRRMYFACNSSNFLSVASASACQSIFSGGASGAPFGASVTGSRSSSCEIFALKLSFICVFLHSLVKCSYEMLSAFAAFLRVPYLSTIIRLRASPSWLLFAFIFVQ